MKKILFIVIFIFSTSLLANNTFLSVNAQQFPIDVEYGSIPETNDFEISVRATPDNGKPGYNTVEYNPHEYDFPTLYLDLSGPSINNVEICVDRIGFESDCQWYDLNALENNARENGGSALVYVTIPCYNEAHNRNDCPSNVVSLESSQPDPWWEDILPSLP